MIPGAREIRDPDAEVARLAAARQSPPADQWTAETVTRVRVTHAATGKWAEAPTRGEALAMLYGDLMAAGDVTVNDARAAHGLPPLEFRA